MLTYFLIVSIGLTLAAMAYRSWKNGLWLLLLTFVTDAILVDPLAIQVGAFTSSIEDIVCSALLVAAVLRIPFQRLSRVRWVWIAFALAGLATFAIGCSQHGVKAAGVEYREYYYVMAAALYFAAFPLDRAQFRTFIRWWILFAGLLVALAVFRWASLALGFANPEQWADVGGSNRIRVLNARQALFICEGAVMALADIRWAKSRKTMILIGVVLLGGVIFLEHRSVWVALAASWAVLYVRPGLVKSKRVWSALAVIAILGLSAYFWLSRSSDDLAASLRTSILEPFDTQNSTLAWRFTMWSQYLDVLLNSGPRGILTGIGFGSAGLYFVGGELVEYSPHNLYIMTANKLGLIGLALLVAGYWLVVARLHRMRETSPEAKLLIALLVGQLIFYCAYEFAYDEGAIAGVAAGFAMAQVAPRRMRRRSAATVPSGQPDVPAQEASRTPEAAALLVVHNFATHYTARTFELLSQRMNTRFLFFSAGGEWYWQRAHGVQRGAFAGRYLDGFTILGTRFAPELVWRLLFDRYDIVMKCVNGRFALPLTFLIARIRRKPFILWTGIWMRLGTRFHRLLHPLTRFLYRHADAVVVYGTHVKRFLVDEGVAPERIFVTTHAVDNSRYARPVTPHEIGTLKASLGVTKDQQIILYLGRLEDCKGLEYLIEAFAALDRPRAVLVLAGAGSLRDALESLVRAKGLEERVRFAGYVPIEESIRYYASAWAYVLPSVTTPSSKECWGLVVNEAFNQGVPVIATTAVGAAAGGLVRNGENGFVVEERNAAALRDAIDRVLSSKELREFLSQNARALVATWTQESMVDQFEAAIRYARNRAGRKELPQACRQST